MTVDERAEARTIAEAQHDSKKTTLNIASTNVEYLCSGGRSAAFLRSLSSKHIFGDRHTTLLKNLVAELATLKSVTSLNLANNELQELPGPDAFPPMLAELTVTGNQLKKLPNLQNFRHLARLHAGANMWVTRAMALIGRTAGKSLMQHPLHACNKRNTHEQHTCRDTRWHCLPVYSVRVHMCVWHACHF